MIQRPSPPDIKTDLVIIGAGVSGLTLADKLSNETIDFWLLGSPFESQLAKAGILEDTPLPEGTVGLKFIENELEVLKSKEINHRTSLCTGIESLDQGYKVLTRFQNFVTKKIVLATGTKQKALGFEGEKEFFHKGISDCTVCDYPLYRDRHVAVVGNHPYTIRAAKLMVKYAETVALLWYQRDAAPELDKVDVYENVTDLKAFGEEVLENVQFKYADGEKTLNINGLFVEGQPVPFVDYLHPLELELDDGYIRINEAFETSSPNIWAIGDITGKTNSYQSANKHALEVASIIVNSFN